MSLRSISQNYYSNFSTLNIPMEEHDNIMDEKNQIEIIGLERSVLMEHKIPLMITMMNLGFDLNYFNS